MFTRPTVRDMKRQRGNGQGNMLSSHWHVGVVKKTGFMILISRALNRSGSSGELTGICIQRDSGFSVPSNRDRHTRPVCT